MPSHRPTVLLVSGAESWRPWLSSFLDSPEVNCLAIYTARTLDEVAAAARLHCAAVIVLVSHHDTLRRDAMWAPALRDRLGMRVFAHPVLVAELAFDKRLMGRVAGLIKGIEAIPELSFFEAVGMAQSDQRQFVLKRISGTEGEGLQVVRSDECADLAASLQSPSSVMLQPFLSGREFSLNVASANGRTITFEPVDKGNTSLAGVHPSRRTRHCPSDHLAPRMARLMRDAAVEMSRLMDLAGVAEFEFIVSDETVYLVEINPRVAATMRMASLACGRSIVTELATAALSGSPSRVDLPAIGHACEFPLPDDAAGLRGAGSLGAGVWVSSRVTVSGDSRAEMKARLAAVQQEIGRAANPA